VYREFILRSDASYIKLSAQRNETETTQCQNSFETVSKLFCFSVISMCGQFKRLLHGLEPATANFRAEVECAKLPDHRAQQTADRMACTRADR